MKKFRFLDVSKDKRNFVVGLLASNSKKPAINYLSSRIFFELDKRFKSGGKTIYCEIQAVQIVSKIFVYAELYKLNRLGFIKIKKVKKYLWVKFTDRGVENIFRFLELDMGDDMRRMAELKGFKVLETTKLFNDPRPYARGFMMVKKNKKDMN